MIGDLIACHACPRQLRDEGCQLLEDLPVIIAPPRRGDDPLDLAQKLALSFGWPEGGRPCVDRPAPSRFHRGPVIPGGARVRRRVRHDDLLVSATYQCLDRAIHQDARPEAPLRGFAIAGIAGS
ncbi:hypothetical protein ACWXWW_05520 [Microbacterium sp. KNMS]